MFKEICYNLQRYYTEHGYRDICAIGVFIAVTIGVYAFASNLDLHENVKIEYSRYTVLSIWIAFCSAFIYFTAFHNYCDSRMSYSEMLYPTAPFAKYLSTFLRCFIFLPLISIALLWTLDFIWVHKLINTETESLMRFLMTSGEPLNYLPLFPFYMLWISSLVFMATLYPRLLSVSLLMIAVLSLIILPGFNSSEYYPFVNMQVVYNAQNIRWSSMYSYLGSSTTIGYLISYLWLIGMPISVLVLSYYRFKESELS